MTTLTLERIENEFVRVDGFGIVEQTGRFHGHQNDCVRVYRNNHPVRPWCYKIVINKDDPEKVHRMTLLREWTMLKALHAGRRRMDRHIIRPLNYLVGDGFVALKTEYYPISLEARLKETTRKQHDDIIRDMVFAVELCWRRNILHGDIGLSNFRWDTKYHKPVLFDFQTAEFRPGTPTFEEWPDYDGNFEIQTCCGPMPNRSVRDAIAEVTNV